MMRIAVAEHALDERLLFESASELGATINTGPVATPNDVAQTATGADALLVTLQPLRAEHIAALPDSVRIVARAGVGLDTIDVEAARARGIRVVFQPGYATNEVADHSATMALAAWRLVGNSDRLIRERGWATVADIGTVRALQDATLGVLGCGRIGRSLITKLSPFVSSVVAFDANPDESLEGVVWSESVDELLAASNLIVLHLPLNESTKHIIDGAAISKMPMGAVLVNVSRGGLIDEDALAAALQGGKLAAAALDVFESEPLPMDSALRSAPNLLLTPHMAWYSTEAAERLTRWSVHDAVQFVRDGTIERGELA